MSLVSAGRSALRTHVPTNLPTPPEGAVASQPSVRRCLLDAYDCVSSLPELSPLETPPVHVAERTLRQVGATLPPPTRMQPVKAYSVDRSLTFGFR